MITFPSVPPAVFAHVLDQLRREGSTVTPQGTGQYEIKGHHWPLGDIVASVAYDGTTVTVDVIKPSSWESTIGGRIQDSITIARREVAAAGAA